MVQKGHGEAGGVTEGIGRVFAGPFKASVDNSFLHTREEIPLTPSNPLTPNIFLASAQVNTSPQVAEASVGIAAASTHTMKMPENGELLSAPVIGGASRSSTTHIS
jgi:hypothetical protein